MTGRKGRVVSDDAGNINYELRAAQDVPLEILNLTEKQRFMDGEKLVAVISEAASSGKSLINLLLPMCHWLNIIYYILLGTQSTEDVLKRNVGRWLFAVMTAFK